MDNYSIPLDDVFGALADTTRRAMIMRLCEGEASVGELAKPFAMALPSVMKHLRILEDSGLVASRKSGRVRTCSLQPQALSTVEFWLVSQRQIWDRRLDRMQSFVENFQNEDPSDD